MKSRPPVNAIAGAGVSRGRLPGATTLGCCGSSQPCEPRGETTQPTPGTTGESTLGSLGVAENPFPAPSTTATYLVSSASVSPPDCAACDPPARGSAARP